MLLMSDVNSSIIQDLRGDYGLLLPDPGRMDRMFNEVQLQLATELECVAFSWQKVVPAYDAVSGLTVNADSAITTVFIDNTDITTDYTGYIFKNETTLEQAMVLSNYSPGADIVALILDHSMTNTEDDDCSLTLESRHVDCPWYVIRPYLDEGVIWDNTPLIPISFSRQNTYHQYTQSGTPDSYSIEEVGRGVCRIHLYPKPSEAGILRVSGSRRTANCFYGATDTTIGASDGSTLTSSDIPIQDADYYVGSDIFIHSGACVGQLRRISQHTPATASTFRFASVFSEQIIISTPVKFELASLLPDEFKLAIDQYIRWQIMSRKAELYKMSIDHKERYEAEKDRLRSLTRRLVTANQRLNPRRGPSSSRFDLRIV